jgi:hypothetical protein
MRSSRPKWLQDTFNYFLDNVFDILTIAAAAYLFLRHQFKPYTSSDIAELAAWIIALLGLIAVSGLWQQHRRLKAIEALTQETHDLVAKHLGGPVKSQDFFWPGDKTILAQELAEAKDIYVVGMVLNRAVRNHMATFGQKLAAGANIRFILLDWQNDQLMEIVPNRSFGSHAKEWWQDRIRQTEGYIQDISSSGDVKGTLKIGYLPYFPSFGMWLIDPDESRGQIHVEIYHHRTPEMNATFSLRATEDEYWYSFFRKQFDVLWDSCGERGRVIDVVPSVAQTDKPTL